MALKHSDGSTRDANYPPWASTMNCRQPEPRIAALIVKALGDADTVLNVGVYSGEYSDGRAISIVHAAADGDLRLRQRHDETSPVDACRPPSIARWPARQ